MEAAVRPRLKRSGRRSFIALEPEVDVGGVTLSSPSRLVFPEAGVTKAMLAAHFGAHMDRLLPILACRPLALVRCPSGRASRSHFQMRPDGLPGHMARDVGETHPAIVVESAQDVIELVQRGTLEIHVRPVRTDKIDRPDRVVFDLDPADDVPFSAVRSAALLIRAELIGRRLEPFVILTGGRGVHVVVPIERRSTVAEVAAWAKAMAGQMEAVAPRRLTTSTAKASRRGRIHISTLRNEPGGAAVAPYSSRVRPGAPIAMPVTWEDLARMERSAAYRVGAPTPVRDAAARMRAVRQRLGRVQWQGL